LISRQEAAGYGSQKPEGIGAVLALAGCFELDAEILASCFRLLASNENKILVAPLITD
jgi:hypothetical protein